MFAELLHRFNKNFPIKTKISFLYIPLLVLVIVSSGTLSNIIYKHYIAELAYRDLNQRTLRFRADIESKLLIYKNISEYLYYNNEIRTFLNKYNTEDINSSAYYDDYRNIDRLLSSYRATSLCNVHLYTFNEHHLTDGDSLIELNKYPHRLSLDEMLKSKDAAKWFFLPNGTQRTPNSDIAISRIIWSDTNTPLAILSLEVGYAIFEEYFKTLDVGNNGWCALMLTNGTILYTKNQVPAVPSNNILVFRESLQYGEIRLEAAYSGRLITEMGRDQRNMLLGITVLFLIAAVLVSFAFSKLISQRIRLFLNKLRSIGREDGMSIIIDGNDEISVIDHTFNDMFQALKEKVKTEQDLSTKVRLVESELLQEQINPHFLYNTLSVIRWSILKKGDNQSADILDKLVCFYRTSLGKGKTIIPVQKELEMVERYIEIQKYTYDENYSVTFDIGPSVEGYYCPKFILQPLVENALLHGIDEMEAGGMLRICVCRNGLNQLKFTVEDNGKGMDEEKVRELNRIGLEVPAGDSTGYGISNIIRRIKLYYGLEYGIEYTSTLGSGTKAAVTIPLCSSEKDNLLISEM